MALLRSRRLETVLGAPVDELSARNIEVLAGNGVSEAFDLDFKGTLYGNSDKERRDLCGDVAALANTSGGVIIVGVEEDEHAIAAATPGVDLGTRSGTGCCRPSRQVSHRFLRSTSSPYLRPMIRRAGGSCSRCLGRRERHTQWW